MCTLGHKLLEHDPLFGDYNKISKLYNLIRVSSTGLERWFTKGPKEVI